MCGICGIVRFDDKSVEDTSLLAMMASMKHRGPDDQDTFIFENIGLGHVRLSIIDLSENGKQPFKSEDGRFQIIFNGEIYNYIELRKELESLGIKFRTKTDTEVLLKAYLQWGEKCLDKLNGMFAFALLDVHTKEMFIARDRYGIKPFYYYHSKDTFIFASDIPPILSVLKKEQYGISNQIMYDFLMFNRTNHTTNTFFKGIKKLQHGHRISIKDKNVSIRKWYFLENNISRPFLDKDDFLQELNNSINFRLRSDVAVGAALSGGLDSSAIVSLIRKYQPNKNIHTFSAVYGKGEVGDESHFIDLYKGIVNNMHFTYPDADSLIEDLDDFIKALSEPIPGTSEYAEYKVMQTAKDFVTVILNGQGADEEMGGYLYMAGFYYKELFSNFKWIKLLSEMRMDVTNHKSFEGPLAFLYFSLPKLIKDKIYNNKFSYINRDFKNQFVGSPEILEKLYDASTLKKSLINHFEYKFEHHLLWADKSGMNFSMEARFPFLDHNFVHRILACNNDQIINNGTTKKMLREAMAGILPDQITHRKDKVGYETPEDKWFRTEAFQSIIKDMLHTEDFKDLEFFNVKECRELFDQHINGKINIAPDIWKWLNVYAWNKRYLA